MDGPGDLGEPVDHSRSVAVHEIPVDRMQSAGLDGRQAREPLPLAPCTVAPVREP